MCGYVRDVRSISGYSSLTRLSTEAEFEVYGVTISASFSYMKSSEVIEESIAFYTDLEHLAARGICEALSMTASSSTLSP